MEHNQWDSFGTKHRNTFIILCVKTAEAQLYYIMVIKIFMAFEARKTINYHLSLCHNFYRHIQEAYNSKYVLKVQFVINSNNYYGCIVLSKLVILFLITVKVK